MYRKVRAAIESCRKLCRARTAFVAFVGSPPRLDYSRQNQFHASRILWFIQPLTLNLWFYCWISQLHFCSAHESIMNTAGLPIKTDATLQFIPTEFLRHKCPATAKGSIPKISLEANALPCHPESLNPVFPSQLRAVWDRSASVVRACTPAMTKVDSTFLFNVTGVLIDWSSQMPTNPAMILDRILSLIEVCF